MSTHTNEVPQGESFPFGINWERFLSTLNYSRIEEAERSLQQMLGLRNLSGNTFLDIGCGSGLFSLAARRLGASVHSFDNDPRSVACTRELKNRYFSDDTSWVIEEGSILNEEYVRSLGGFEIVYSWGVLHHTGNMMKALENAVIPVKDDGLIYIAIYNDQGLVSSFWTKVKKTYCTNSIGKFVVTTFFIPLFVLRNIAVGIFKYKNPLGHFVNYKKNRGMSIYYDWIDWLGGYPYEVAKPEKIFLFYTNIGFQMTNMTTTNRLGCNQFVFQRVTQETT